MADPSRILSRTFGWVLRILLVLFVFYLCLPLLLNSDSFPPNWYERRGQRQKVLKRVHSAGGWAAIQRDCDTLVQQNWDGAFYWHRGLDLTNPLPPALVALNPKEVRFESPSVLRDFKDEPKVAVVRIKIFGLHATGGHSTPYFGLEVVSGPGAETYRPRPSRGGASGNCYGSFSPVTNRVYEAY